MRALVLAHKHLESMFSNRHAAILIVLTLMGCSSPVEQRSLGYSKSYDPVKMGPQFDFVYPDETRFQEEFGYPNERISITTDLFPEPIRTVGWSIVSGSTGRTFELPPEIFRTLVLVTKAERPNDEQYFSLESDVWLWNNTGKDSAMLFDSSGRLVDKFVFGKD